MNSATSAGRSASWPIRIRRNTEELEDKVQARTQALEAANLEMRRAHQKIKDSLDYASLIQRATLSPTSN